MSDNGYRLWLCYDKVTDNALLSQYKDLIRSYHITGTSVTNGIIRKEFAVACEGLLGGAKETSDFATASVVVARADDPRVKDVFSKVSRRAQNIGEEGFVIVSHTTGTRGQIFILASSDIALLYGSFHFFRLLQTNSPIRNLLVIDSPRISRRILNHWDNLDRTVERGYAGFSLWDWHKLPGFIDPRYEDYARANASIGINGTVLTNVNANAQILRPEYLEKVKALADLFRPYGIKVYLTARFSAPVELGKLQTADPHDELVKRWWAEKCAEIYSHIPDFGGFLVKANSEGQPGPQNYGRSHADGANMLAEALRPFGGIVMWRAFVYDNQVPVDRTKQSYNEFEPLDGKFADNVILQVKNGPLDFQPREPFHPLFGAMKRTPVMPEFQITQEYLGFSTHLVYLATLFRECLDADTYAKGKGSMVASVADGTLFGNKLSAVAGVANIGNDINWTGHHFGQANWFAFGRLAWNHRLTSQSIADEWIRMTFTNDHAAVKTITGIMLPSRETTVNYMTPLGLHHIMGYNHHYGPGPWITDKPRADWTSTYYHKADSVGIGFDRTPSGSNALEQYQPKVRERFADPAACPDEYLLWFHHLPWNFKMKSGKSLWDELCFSYYGAVDSVVQMQQQWQTVRNSIDDERYRHVESFMEIQRKEAELWRDACVLYFKTFSRMPIPSPLKPPAKKLEYYKSLEFPYAPGIRPQW